MLEVCHEGVSFFVLNFQFTCRFVRFRVDFGFYIGFYCGRLYFEFWGQNIRKLKG